jgi:pyruvate dehydrogenase E1 component alpha subunit
MYGMGTSAERAMSMDEVATKACAYELASEVVDGMDVLAMRQATQRAVERARKQSLPTLIEARTYRYMGHSMSDPGKYRTREEIEKHQERDPIKLFRSILEENGMLTEEQAAEFESQVKDQVEQAVRFAEESPEPDPRELTADIYANPITRD